MGERAKFSSYRGLFDVPSSVLSGRLLQWLGIRPALMLGYVAGANTVLVLWMCLALCLTVRFIVQV